MEMRRAVWRGAFLPTFILALFFSLFVERASADGGSNPLESVVRIDSHIPPDTRTAERLGTQRVGAGVVIADDGLILTIGYLILEADSVSVTDSNGRRYPADIVGYDHATGFGLLRAHEGLKVPAALLGSSAQLSKNQKLLAASIGPVAAEPVQLRSIQPFAGGWEYLIDDALFTTPAIDAFGGAALFGEDGRLVGIGSLVIGDSGGSGEPGNMFVPIDLLKPVLADLLAFGRSTEPARPWVGVYPAEVNGFLVVSGVAENGPGAAAGLVFGDVVVAVNGEPVREMAAFFRAVWALGPAGTRIPLTVFRQGVVVNVDIESRDRLHWLKLNQTY